MKFQKTRLQGVYVIDLEPREDNRGYFTRVFGKDEIKKAGIQYTYSIVQINRSLTVERGTIRGMHYQRKPKEEDKLVQCLFGEIFDVAIDLRRNSKTYGKWVGEILSAKNKKMLWIPKGFAHGFQTLTKDCVVEYFVSQYYSPKYEKGIRWNDPLFKIDWPIKKAKTSDKDSQWPFLGNSIL
ncbi:MAG: dTDP-4-dehydrorhamnose 3,5-epimerase [Nitrosotalea sp.]